MSHLPERPHPEPNGGYFQFPIGLMLHRQLFSPQAKLSEMRNGFPD